MKRCPVCKTVYPDDANFCPMDAGHLEPAPAGGALPSLDLPTMVTRLVNARYQLGPQIGGRRTGEVYSGEDITNNQAVALKLVSPAVFPTPLVAQRTERELKQLMKVSSDRITKVIEVGKSGDRMFVAMELVSGVTLAEIIAINGALPPDQAARLGVEIGEGLAEAAKLGVIHRDVSPKNVMVVADARGNRRVKILNFGIPTPVTEKVLGIPEFLSPEQAEGKPVDQRSNIYSMGALLYTMLTGTPPFAGSVDEVLRQQVSAAVTPPSQKAPARGIPPELERLILKALEKASSRRHLTLRQLLGELEAIAGHLPLSHPVAVSAPPQRTTGTQAAQRPSGAQQRQSASIPAQEPPAHDPRPPRRERSSAAKTIVGMPFNAANLPPPDKKPEPPRTQPAVIIEPQAQPQQPAWTPPAAPAPVPEPAVMLTHAESVAPTAPARPVQPAPAPVAAGPAPKKSVGRATGKKAALDPGSSGSKKSRFRETMWFKKGEVDEAAAEGESPPPADDLPIEDRYKDDGTITAADRERLSLRGGGAPVRGAKGPIVPGERMRDEDLARELGGGNKLLYIVFGIVGLLIALALVYVLVIRK